MWLLYLNIAVGGIAVGLMLLVLRGMLHHMSGWRAGLAAMAHDALWLLLWLPGVKRIRGRIESDIEAGDLMRQGTGLFHIKGILRVGSWDLLIPVFFLATTASYARAPYISLINLSFASLTIIGSLSVLAAYYRNIPKDERAGYSWLTAPFYPWQGPPR